MSLSRFAFWILLVPVTAFLAACASGTYKARQEMRDKAVASTGLLCEFVNGEQHTDVDVELNLQMAKRCDVSKPISLTNYRNSSEMFGVIYCCQAAEGRKAVRKSEVKGKPASKPAPASTPSEKSDDEVIPN